MTVIVNAHKIHIEVMSFNSISMSMSICYDVMVAQSNATRILSLMTLASEYLGTLTLKKQVSAVGNAAWLADSNIFNCIRYDPISDGKRLRAHANCKNDANSACENDARTCQNCCTIGELML